MNNPLDSASPTTRLFYAMGEIFARRPKATVEHLSAWAMGAMRDMDDAAFDALIAHLTNDAGSRPTARVALAALRAWLIAERADGLARSRENPMTALTFTA